MAVVLKYLADGRTEPEIVDEFPELELEDISECLRYAAWARLGPGTRASTRSMKFLADVGISRRLVDRLREQGYSVVRVP